MTDANLSDADVFTTAAPVALCVLQKLMNMTTTNCTDADPDDITSLLEEKMAARYRSPSEVVMLTIVYCVIFVSGCVGNVCTCIVIMKNSYMHTATNYYLFSLAISDVLTLIVGLPPELYTVWEAYPWRFGEPYCLLKTFLTEMTSSASVLTIAAFTVERYVAICHPLRAQAMSSLHRAFKTIFFIWLLSCAAALPFPVHTRVYHYVIDPRTHAPIAESLICNIQKEWFPRMRYVFQLTTFVLFIIPMTLISVLYVCIGYALHRSNGAVFRQQSTTSGVGRPRRSIIKMLVAVVVAFFICWAPFHTQRLLTAYVHEWTPTLLEIQTLLFYISGVFYFTSATVNPILYNVMSRRYRQSFKETLCYCFESADHRRKLGNNRGRFFTERSTCYSVPMVTSQRRERELRNLLSTTATGAELRRSLSDSSNVDHVKVGSWRMRLLANRRHRCNGRQNDIESPNTNGSCRSKSSDRQASLPRARNGGGVELAPMIENANNGGRRTTKHSDRKLMRASAMSTM